MPFERFSYVAITDLYSELVVSTRPAYLLSWHMSDIYYSSLVLLFKFVQGATAVIHRNDVYIVSGFVPPIFQFEPAFYSRSHTERRFGWSEPTFLHYNL